MESKLRSATEATPKLDCLKKESQNSRVSASRLWYWLDNNHAGMRPATCYKSGVGNPFLFGAIYILMIPAYALIYSIMPASFYHSTVGYEASIKGDVQYIEVGLRDAVVSGVREHYKSDIITIGNAVEVDVASIDVIDFHVKNGKISFSLGFEGIKDGKLCAYSFSVSPLPEISSPECLLLMDHLAPDGLKLSDLCPYREGQRLKLGTWGSNARGSVMLPTKLQERIKGYRQAQEGFPSNASGNFGRMFYFSAVTITTVGYGDIVPITTAARTLVASEAILGVVIIGFFLNAVARPRS